MAVLHPHPPFGDLTYYPTSRRIRGTRGKDTIVDSRRAVLVWEPGKKVPIYAFPARTWRSSPGPPCHEPRLLDAMHRSVPRNQVKHLMRRRAARPEPQGPDCGSGLPGGS